MVTPQAPRGMSDHLPELAAGHDALRAVILARAFRYGYPRISTPVVEQRQVFTRTAGESSEAVSKEMYDVSLHQKGDLVLRPEGTAAVTRAFLENGLHHRPQPVRLSYWEAMFRGQRPQLLRYRQFWQWGLECFGGAEAAADIEIVAFTSGLFAEVGLTELVLKINTIGSEASQMIVRERLAEYFGRYERELDDDCRTRLRTSVLRIFDCKVPHDREIASGAPKVRDLVSNEDKAHFAAVIGGLDRLGIRYEFDDRLVRGFDYYTRTVFEWILTDPAFTKAGDIAVAGGGRYDGLVQAMGGPPMPGVGVAGGVDVLLEAIRQQGLDIALPILPEVYIVSGDPSDIADRTQLAEPLRNAGFRVAIDYSARPLDRQLESAAKHGAKVAVIRGTEEARGGHVIVRVLSTKEQRVTRLAAVLTEVRRHVAQYPKPSLHPPEAPEVP